MRRADGRHEQKGEEPQSRDRVLRVLPLLESRCYDFADLRHSVGLAILFVGAVGIRLWWADAFAVSPAFGDPDGYVQLARELADGTRPWRWTLKAVQWNEFYKAPLYQVTLSIFTAYPAVFSVPHAAFVVNACLNGLAVVALYVLGASLHNARAGWVAAVTYALWAPNIMTSATLWQEHMFNPLCVVGLALAARAIDRVQSPWHWAMAGGVFGLCALTRSVVAYFVPVAVAFVVMLGGTRLMRIGAGRLLAGFTAVTLPYVVFISLSIGHFMFIEDSGSIALRRLPPANPEVTILQFMKDPNRGTTAVESARYVLADALFDPAGFAGRKLDYLRLLFKPAGAALVTQLVAEDAADAARRKSVVHLVLDLPFAVAALLFPLGIVLARNRHVAWLLGLWILQYVVLLALTLWAGTRYRSPIDPAAIALAAVVVAGGWHRPTRLSVASASLGVAAVALTIGLSLPATLDARANYGVGAWAPHGSADATFSGRAGLNVIGRVPALVFSLQDVSEQGAQGDVRVEIRLDRQLVDAVSLMGSEPRQLSYALKEPGLHYLELTATAADGRQRLIRIRLI
jgi:hypothetical protein